MNIYKDLEDLYYKMKAQKLQLRNEIALANAKIGELEGIMTDIEGILSENGKHVHEHFEEGGSDTKDLI